MKCYSTKGKGIKAKTSYNPSYKYGSPHLESNIPNVVFTDVKDNETKKVGFETAFSYLDISLVDKRLHSASRVQPLGKASWQGC